MLSSPKVVARVHWLFVVAGLVVIGITCVVTVSAFTAPEPKTESGKQLNALLKMAAIILTLVDFVLAALIVFTTARLEKLRDGETAEWHSRLETAERRIGWSLTTDQHKVLADTLEDVEKHPRLSWEYATRFPESEKFGDDLMHFFLNTIEWPYHKTEFPKDVGHEGIVMYARERSAGVTAIELAFTKAGVAFDTVIDDSRTTDNILMSIGAPPALSEELTATQAQLAETERKLERRTFDRDRLIALLRPIESRGLHLAYVGNDPEAHALAVALHAAVSNANWFAATPELRFEAFPEPPVGLLIMASASDRFPPYTEQLCAALIECGLETKLLVNPNVTTGLPLLLVGHKSA
ncbi:MAG: hypothetical protein IH991_20800 [Planctomycetes bacterium]|nr:hypothetical protein [Planctomycetota bacterium]